MSKSAHAWRAVMGSSLSLKVLKILGSIVTFLSCPGGLTLDRRNLQVENSAAILPTCLPYIVFTIFLSRKWSKETIIILWQQKNKSFGIKAK